jgi:arylsulfatase A-like enzyme
MTDTWARRHRGLLPLAAGLLAPLGGCGEPAPAARLPWGGYQRVELVPLDAPGPVPEERVLARLEPALEPDRWSPAVGQMRFTEDEDAAGSLASSLVLEGAGAGDLAAIRTGDLDLGGATEVRLWLLATRPCRVVVTLLGDGERMAAEFADVQASDHPQLVAARFVRPLVARAAPDALELRFQAARSAIFVREVSILVDPPSARAAALREPELLPANGEARRGWLVSPHRALSGTARARPGARLVFSYVQTPSLRSVPGSSGRLRIAATLPDGGPLPEGWASGGWASERVIDLAVPPAGPTWLEAQLELAPEHGSAEGTEVALRFSLESPGADAACAIADVALVAEPASRPPPVLLVTSDTHRADFIGAAARPADVRTPNLDRLAARGVTFQDCLASTNITNPSHVALMTGVSPRDHGVRNNSTRLAESAPTLAEHLRDLGYRTWAAVSSRHLRDEVSGLGQGFDRMALPFPTDTRRAGDTLGVVEAWLADPGPAPVFLWVHLFDAHAPYDPPAEHAGLYWPPGKDPRDPALPDPGLPESLLAPAKLQGLRDLDYPLAAYKGEVDYLDAQLGRLLDRAPFGAGAAGIVAFVADHGESFGEHRIYYGHSGLYPQTIQVPLILAWPGGPRGERRTDPVEQIDLSRTLLDLVGAEGLPFRGRNLVDPPAAGPPGELPGEPSRPRFALSAHGLDASVTAGGHHFVLHLVDHREWSELDKAPRHGFRLYDLERDPECTEDLAASEPEVARSLHALLVAWLQAPEDLGWKGSTSEDPELAAALAELGYADAGEPAEPELWVADDCAWCRRVR